MTKIFIDYYMRLYSLKYSLLYVASSVKGKCEYSETNSLYVCECVYMCEGETSFYFMQRNMSELYVIFMTEVSFFNSWPISLEMSFRIKYVVRVIHCCPRTRTRYTHTRTYCELLSISRRTNLRLGYTCEKFQESQTAAFAV